MFTLIADESTQQLGIEVHKLRFYTFGTSLLTGKAMLDSTNKNFSVLVAPQPSLFRSQFDASRAQTVSMGVYPSLDAIDMAVRKLDTCYEEVLKVYGADKHVLVDEGNARQMVPDANASSLRYGDSIIRARNLQAFRMVNENVDIAFNTVVGKIVPIFLSALGLREYKVGHDLSEGGSGEVQFLIDRVAMFSFKPPAEKGGTASFNRYVYTNGRFNNHFGGEVNGHNLKKQVFEWLVDAARDLRTQPIEQLEAHLDELARDVREQWVLKKSDVPIFQPQSP